MARPHAACTSRSLRCTGLADGGLHNGFQPVPAARHASKEPIAVSGSEGVCPLSASKSEPAAWDGLRAGQSSLQLKPCSSTRQSPRLF